MPWSEKWVYSYHKWQHGLRSIEADLGHGPEGFIDENLGDLGQTGLDARGMRKKAQAEHSDESSHQSDASSPSPTGCSHTWAVLIQAGL